jgi:hypothetical protein
MQTPTQVNLQLVILRIGKAQIGHPAAANFSCLPCGRALRRHLICRLVFAISIKGGILASRVLVVGCSYLSEEKNEMKYGIAWLLGIPTTLIVIWFLLNHA